MLVVMIVFCLLQAFQGGNYVDSLFESGCCLLDFQHEV